MELRDISILLVKIGGVWLVVYAVIGLTTNLPYLFADLDFPWWEYIAVATLPVVLPAVVGLALFFFPATITNRLVAGDELSESKPTAFFEIERVALSVLGVFLVFRTISDAVAHSAYLVYANRLSKKGVLIGNILDPERFAAIVATGAEFIIAAWLIFGSKGLVTLFTRIRGRG